MKRFIDLKPEEALGLEKEIYQNAKRLEVDAFTLVSANRSYATATSLLVLSLEELIKATIILLHSQGYKVYQIKDIKLVFTKHEFRHSVAQFLEVTIGGFNISKNLDRKRNTSVSRNKGVFGAIGEVLLTILENTPQAYRTYKNVSNLENFNNYKNNGLYVDYRVQLQTPIVKITEKEYSQVKSVHKTIDELFNNLDNLFTTKPKTAKETKQIKAKKRDLHLLIDDALKDFSLKEIKNEVKK